MSIWDKRSFKSSQSSTESKRLLPAKEIDLAYRIAEENRHQAFDEKYEWMYHYHENLTYMYNLFLNHMNQANIRDPPNILSFNDFRQYVYENTDIYLDPKVRKRKRPLA